MREAWGQRWGQLSLPAGLRGVTPQCAQPGISLLGFSSSQAPSSLHTKAEKPTGTAASAPQTTADLLGAQATFWGAVLLCPTGTRGEGEPPI